MCAAAVRGCGVSRAPAAGVLDSSSGALARCDQFGCSTSCMLCFTASLAQLLLLLLIRCMHAAGTVAGCRFRFTASLALRACMFRFTASSLARPLLLIRGCHACLCMCMCMCCQRCLRCLPACVCAVTAHVVVLLLLRRPGLAGWAISGSENCHQVSCQPCLSFLLACACALTADAITLLLLASVSQVACSFESWPRCQHCMPVFVHAPC